MPDSTKPRVLILGAGGHGRVVLDILLQAAKYEVAGFLDNNAAIHGRRIDGFPVLGSIDSLAQIASCGTGFQPVSSSRECGTGFQPVPIRFAIVAIGDNGVRRGLARQVESAGLELISAIHPSATLARNATIGRNVVICSGVVICAHCQIGDSVILNTGSIIDHQTMIGEGSHICPGARIAARVKVESGTFIGIGATIIPKITLGCESIIGAGSVVLEDVAPLETVVGVPARPIKSPALADADEAALLLPAHL